MKYTILTIECGEEKVQLETNSFKLARDEYERQKQCNRGRVRINGGRDPADLSGGQAVFSEERSALYIRNGGLRHDDLSRRQDNGQPKLQGRL